VTHPAPGGRDALTYAPEGGSLAADLLSDPPTGYRAREDAAVIGTGRACFADAVDAVLRWEVQERVGIRVVPDAPAATDAPGTETHPAAGPGTDLTAAAGGRPNGPHPRLRAGDVAVLHIRAYGVTTRAPIRAVRVVDREDRGGFAYGTRRGHPESGEVAFLVELGADDTVRFVVRSFSRPATPLWRVLWPFVQWKSRRTTARYLRVLAPSS
jgi:uncharacterized protein (UPF0548 family)